MTCGPRSIVPSGAKSDGSKEPLGDFRSNDQGETAPSCPGGTSGLDFLRGVRSFQIPHERHVIHADRQAGRIFPAPARLPSDVPECIAEEAARDGIGEPVFAARGAREVGERGDAVERLLPNSFAYGVTAAYITAVWREGNECQRSSDWPGLNSALPSPESGRARPVARNDVEKTPIQRHAAPPVARDDGPGVHLDVLPGSPPQP
jgi:hypothetical protein